MSETKNNNSSQTWQGLKESQLAGSRQTSWLFTSMAEDLNSVLPWTSLVSGQSQRAKKVVSDSPGLVDFAIGLVNSVLNLPDRQVKIFRRIKITEVL